MKAVLVKEWASFLLDWAKPAERGAMAESPRRQEIKISGELPNLEGQLSSFHIGTSRDPYGSVIHLKPDQTVPLIVGKPKENKNAQHQPSDKGKPKDDSTVRNWNHWWAKVAVRAGYLSPQIDPSALALLRNLRHNNARIEFIVDTNVLITGVGHWLVRYVGDLSDLVRTVVTDLEIQRFGDAKKWTPSNFKELSSRTCYLMSSRFLEYLREEHPVWRRLDIEEETALFVSSASLNGQKEPGNDTLMLRSVRRSIQDQVPGLIRLFVTSDQSSARTALHDLPPGATIAAYVNPISSDGTYLSSVHWWPSRSGEGGAYMSSLAAFAYEATCLCDSVSLTKEDGSSIRIRTPDRPQFPSDWSEPAVWVDETGTRSEASEVKSQAISVKIAVPLSSSTGKSTLQIEDTKSALAEKPQHNRIAISPPQIASHKALPWPFVQTELRVPILCAARANGGDIISDVMAAIMTAVREKSALSKRVFPGAEGPARELRTFLRAVDAINTDDQPGTSAANLPSIFSSNAIDQLSQILTKASGYNSLVSGLRDKKSVKLTGLELPSRSATALAGLAKLLGQVVEHDGELIYGGAYISRDEFIDWFQTTVKAEESGPLGGALIADIARKALYEISLSPARLETAMRATIEGSPLADLEFSAGGTPERVFEEEVAVLTAKGWNRRLVSADGLLGYRSVRRRK